MKESTAGPIPSDQFGGRGADARFWGLTNGELRADLRHRSTTYSKTRNDLLPNWLRWKWDLAYDLDGDGILEAPKPAGTFT